MIRLISVKKLIFTLLIAWAFGFFAVAQSRESKIKQCRSLLFAEQLTDAQACVKDLAKDYPQDSQVMELQTLVDRAIQARSLHQEQQGG